MSKSCREGQFQVPVPNFDGDPCQLDHFFSLVQDLSTINKWKEDKTLLFIRSKLSGPALTYFLENSKLQKITNLTELKQEFQNFFKTSETVSLINLNNLVFLPNETVKSFAHRLNVVVKKVYNSIDEESLDKIKYVRFIQALPSHFRVKLLEEKVQKYSEAIERAQDLQNIANSENSLSVVMESSTPSITEQLQKLADQVNAMSLAAPPVKDRTPENDSDRYHESSRSRPSDPRLFKTRNIHVKPKQNTNRQRIRCQLCDSFSHTAQQCFKFKSLQRVTNQQNRSYRPRYQKASYNSSNNRYNNLN